MGSHSDVGAPVGGCPAKMGRVQASPSHHWPHSRWWWGGYPFYRGARPCMATAPADSSLPSLIPSGVWVGGYPFCRGVGWGLPVGWG